MWAYAFYDVDCSCAWLLLLCQPLLLPLLLQQALAALDLVAGLLLLQPLRTLVSCAAAMVATGPAYMNNG